MSQTTRQSPGSPAELDGYTVGDKPPTVSFSPRHLQNRVPASPRFRTMAAGSASSPLYIIMQIVIPGFPDETFSMCKSVDTQGIHRPKCDRLKIRGFYLRLSVSESNKSVPDSLILVYLPRINGSPLEVADSKIRPDSAAFVTLHRIMSPEAVFASRERVRASESTRFEVYMREERVLKGIFRKDEKDEWKMDCRCALESGSAGVSVSEAQVCVAVEGHVAMSETVEMVPVRRKARAVQWLEEIPEEREVDAESDGFSGEEEYESDDGDFDANGKEMEMDVEGFGWAVDLGIWVMCLGVGYLLSQASSKSIRRRRTL